MGQVLETLKAEGYEINPDDLKHIWPTRHQHINVYGKYDFDLQAAWARVGFRPLRSNQETQLS